MSEPTEAGSLEQRVRRLEDRTELWELVGRYCLAIDDQDHATLAELYASDAVYTGPKGRCEGREEVVAYLREALGRYGTSVHTAHQQVLDFDGPDTATGIVTAHVEMSVRDVAESLFGAMRYFDSYVREDGRWRFRERALKFVHIAPWGEVSQSLTGELPKRFPGSEPAPADLPPSAERT